MTVSEKGETRRERGEKENERSGRVEEKERQVSKIGERAGRRRRVEVSKSAVKCEWGRIEKGREGKRKIKELERT